MQLLPTHPKVSILVPVYNAEKYLQQCIESLIAQTYDNLEIIIVDDGSVDSSGLICDDYGLLTNNITVYHIKNSGVAYARNQLLEKTTGEYILYVDADDWIEPDMVEGLITCALQHNLDVTMSGYNKEYSDISQSSNDNHHDGIIEIWNNQECIKKFLKHEEINGSLWNKLIKKEITEGVLFDNNIFYGEDALFIWKCLPKVKKLGLLPHKYYHHRINQYSISNQKFDYRKMSSHAVWQIFCNDTCNKYPEHATLAKANFAVADFWLLYFAANDKYPKDTNIRAYQHNLKKQLLNIKRLNLLSLPKLVFAIILSTNYNLAGLVLRSLKR